MAWVAEHLSIDDLPAACGEPDARTGRHLQTIWLLPKGHTMRPSQTWGWAAISSEDVDRGT